MWEMSLIKTRSDDFGSGLRKGTFQVLFNNFMQDSKKADLPSKRSSPSPALDSPTHSKSHPSPVDPASPDSADMALVAHNNPASLLTGPAGINKRYRPAPAKTFQCRGYGEKHTGERPFTCHCGKQFSRLDNLRQHAQTVHADKQEQNEQMMRDLTSLHATMAAANKTGAPRGKRGQAVTSSNLSSNESQENESLDGVKQEDMGDSFRGRPGTSTGYEGDHNGIIYQGTTWHVQSSDMDRAASRPTNNHSFRDPGQSFLAPLTSTSSTSPSQSQSFLGLSNSFNFIPDFARDSRPGSSNSRPPTAGGPDAIARTLPPLSAVVSAALPTSSSGSFPVAPHSTQHILPIPGALAFRRPSTANRPGTAPASYFASKSAFAGSGLVSRTELSVSGYGQLGTPTSTSSYGYDAEPTSPTGPSYESPFSFHPPTVADPSYSATTTTAAAGGSLASSPPVNPRKRPYPGSDGDDGSRRESGGIPPDYEYGSESRPQSRRLSVMELCNDTHPDAGTRTLLSAGSRPTTSSGLAASASTLAIVDRASHTSPQLLPGTASPTAGTNASTATGTSRGGTQTLGGSGISSESFSSSAAAVAAAAAPIFHNFRGSFTSPPLSDASSSPRSATSSFTASHRSGIRPSPPSPDTTGATLSRRGAGAESHRDQVRVSVASPHSPAALGMRACAALQKVAIISSRIGIFYNLPAVLCSVDVLGAP
ncbi:hypothetical protein PILCRDRAFT_797354 [Piloderma croceum F 1598]|uniref:C2H2-type domain-containing protein n=1 Tax=Piloderma croceum (strain F 1598) TaxID=765440 RepID=A0A0C3F936_PILCF|nr:hypothetical protein PILCRDRAFT_797354 [Piloderma croceum F 1598]